MFKKVIMLFIILFPVLTIAQSANQVLQERLSSFHSLTANFQQMIVSSDGTILQKSSGVLAIKRPGKFRWDIQKPMTQLIITNGKKVWIYDPDLEQVTIRQLSASVGETPVLLLTTSQAQLQKSFTISALSSKQRVESFQLTPKNKEEVFGSIILTFNNQALSQMKLFNQLGQQTVIEFSNVQVNPNLDDTRFNFSIPEGVDIINGVTSQNQTLSS